MTSPVEIEADRVCSMPGWESVCANSAWYGSVRDADLRSGLRWGEEDSVTLADGVSTARCLTLGGMQRRDQRATGLGTDISSNSRGGEASDSELMGNNWRTDAGRVKRGEMEKEHTDITLVFLHDHMKVFEDAGGSCSIWFTGKSKNPKGNGLCREECENLSWRQEKPSVRIWRERTKGVKSTTLKTHRDSAWRVRTALKCVHRETDRGRNSS